MAVQSKSPDQYLSLVHKLGALYPNLDEAFARFDAGFQTEMQSVAEQHHRGNQVIPDISFNAITKRGFTAETANMVKQRGCVIVRGVVGEEQARRWHDQLLDYLSVNNYYTTLAEDLARQHSRRSKHTNMLDVYWSQPQLEARQSANMRELQRYLNSLWNVPDSGMGHFNPDKLVTYADRVRIREPLDQTLGLVAHVDSSSLESWFDLSSLESSYHSVLSGELQQFDPFSSSGRVYTNKKPQADACSMFRTFQGWLALSEQGKSSGTLQLIPSVHCTAWLLLFCVTHILRNESEVYPVPGKAFNLQEDLHGPLLQGLCGLPTMYPGDTIWWHPDVMHAVEFANESLSRSSVMFMGAAPDCDRNRAHLNQQLRAFERGLSPPDFPAVHAEQYYSGRGNKRHLNEHGLDMMGF